jgi:chromosome segregation ATPase
VTETRRKRKRKTMKTKKKMMTEDQLGELQEADGRLAECREDLVNQKSNLSAAEAHAREAQAILKKEKNLLARSEKEVTVAKKHLAKLKAKYKGWMRPKESSASSGTGGTGDGPFDQVTEGMP